MSLSCIDCFPIGSLMLASFTFISYSFAVSIEEEMNIKVKTEKVKNSLFTKNPFEFNIIIL